MLGKHKHTHVFLSVPRQDISPTCERLLSWMRCVDDASRPDTLQQHQQQPSNKSPSLWKRMSPRLRRRSSNVNRTGKSYAIGEVSKSHSFDILQVTPQHQQRAAAPLSTATRPVDFMEDEPDTMIE